ncbi:flagellar hook-basal body protein FliE [Ectothiorhodospira haloalkaliphila]|uniref:Flagellar hook-basal body complex protein FliE n=1 Tax=Ectothiorhodospira haloalkaliphila TaxID=421628 RepID=W8KJS8_9GAMM|nr:MULTISPECIES: flagellar hook-basal body complex protein FliE [Ectothiorhodospira]AHK79418.1 flagellar hook-basal body protein FliE [Ectothiorhodospira haloalkaliphila]MCG5494067.1 flagellar hook-basal body complex protein FliE [Ectothiorhodospira variabilis]MCG5498000.1 flagellar hook-basal body complex protein FliE [Ectothiorhodospira variabilis]MCG5503403.1 flagellar hook-basal body complex protein FliE [Ectothiorhodospira variabilis]MCG5506509.1 flagellar hook-basal body complex protein 
MSEQQINQVLQQMRSLAASAGVDAQPAVSREIQPGQPNFRAMLRESLDKVSETQKSSNSLATRFELGDPDVDLPQVMVAKQKASVAFEATTQIRNRLVSAYQDIMNMQV